MSQEIKIWIQKILILIGFSILLYFIYLSKSIITLLIIAGFITFLIIPLVEKWKKYKIPEWFTVIFVYFILFILFSITVGTILPIVITYISKGISAIALWAQNAQSIYLNEGLAGFHLHPYVENFITNLIQPHNLSNLFKIIQQNSSDIQKFITLSASSITQGSVSLIGGIGGILTQITFIAIASFFMVLERKGIAVLILDVLPKDIGLYIKTHFANIQNVCTSWIKATILLSLTIFTMTYIGLLLVNWIFGFGIESIISLALISGIMEFIPYIGPLLALIPALIIGIGTSWNAAIAILILYLIVQQLEGNVFVPIIMSKNLDISPLFVFVIMLFGGAIGGILGIIVAIPIAGIIKIFYSDFHKKRKTRFRYGICYNEKNPPIKEKSKSKKISEDKK